MRLLFRPLAFAALAIALLPNVSQSQVVPAIKGGGSQINVFGLYSLVNPDGKSTLDYPPGTKFSSSAENSAGKWNDLAYTFGADFRLGRFVFGQPALGARMTRASGSFASEDTYMFGPEVHYVFGRFRPYGDFLLGKGDITYSGGYQDDSIVYQPGGGVDYRMSPRVSLRLVDFQYQIWNLGVHTYPANFFPGVPQVSLATTLQPYTLNFGILFRVR